ncbi:nucleotide disphospho-sugar-binding domain-containing protein [Amycolatopsis sp. NPDC004079]|uniref:Nucleotide disphospho-sugar-binding domain-containing protein n=1 Tax=Amycolatopsis halotolerans TaxID=330083 RepID=A0ABV7QCY4_9PSEU
MRVLALPSPSAATHIMAMVPLMWALRAAGHEVLFAGTPDIAGSAHAAGFSFAALGSSENFNRDLYVDPGDRFPVEEWKHRETTRYGRFLVEMLADLHADYADAALPDYERFAREWQPDLLLPDSTALIGRVLGGVLGVPVATHRYGVDATGPVYHDKARWDLAPLCDRLGLAGLPDSDLVLDPCPPSLQSREASPGLRMRYVPFNGAGTVADWALRPSPRKRVCICFGKTLLSICGPRPLVRVAEALAGLDDVEVVLAVSKSDVGLIGELPPHWRVVELMPLTLFLPGCDLLIALGGSGAALSAAALGVPQLVLPQVFDHFDCASRIQEAGAGLSIDTRAAQADIGGIRDAISTILGDPSYAAAARRVREENEAGLTPAEVVPVLEQLAADRRSGEHRVARPRAGAPS